MNKSGELSRDFRNFALFIVVGGGAIAAFIFMLWSGLERASSDQGVSGQGGGVRDAHNQYLVENESVNRPTNYMYSDIEGDGFKSDYQEISMGGKDPLRLLAIFQTHDQNIASAVVLVEGVGAYRYWTGEEIGKNYTLMAILPHKVLLKYQDNVEVLYLQPLSDSERITVQNIMDEESLTQENEEEDSPESIQKKAFLESIDLHPVAENSPYGYIVGDKFPEDAQQKTGVRPGDVVFSVNGYPLGEDSTDILAWKSVQAGEKATIVVRRGGEEFIVYYP